MDFHNRIWKGLRLTMADIIEAPLKCSRYPNGKPEILMSTRSHNTAAFGGLLYVGTSTVVWLIFEAPKHRLACLRIIGTGVYVPRLSPYQLTVHDCLFNSQLDSISTGLFTIHNPLTRPKAISYAPEGGVICTTFHKVRL